jgi:hypothetical protein
MINPVVKIKAATNPDSYTPISLRAFPVQVNQGDKKTPPKTPPTVEHRIMIKKNERGIVWSLDLTFVTIPLAPYLSVYLDIRTDFYINRINPRGSQTIIKRRLLEVLGDDLL